MRFANGWIRRTEPPSERVLVTGGAGYLGSVLVEHLLESGFQVRVLDSLLFGARPLERFRGNSCLQLVTADIRDSAAVRQALSGTSAVIHLAGVVGDAACQELPRLAVDVNCTATSDLIAAAQKAGVRRFLFASSCSVYGASERWLDESSPLNPLSLYARTKQDGERALLGTPSLSFAASILRFGTLFGVSPRMRFDLVVNRFVAQASSTRRITVWNGDQWRPFLHVSDAARALLACLVAWPGDVSGQIFNVGSQSMNCQIASLARLVAQRLPGTSISHIPHHDQRNYRVSFDKIRRILGFRCKKTLEFGIEEIYELLEPRTRKDWCGENAAFRAVSEKCP